MTKATLDLPTGAHVDIDGSPEEISRLLDFYSSSTQPERGGSFATALTLPRKVGGLAGGLKLNGRILGIFVVVLAASLAVMALFSYWNLKSLNDGLAAMYFDQLLPQGQLGQAQAALGQARADEFQFIFVPEGRDESEKAIAADWEVVESRMSLYKASYLTAEEATGLTKFDSAWAAYKDATTGVLSQVRNGDEKAAGELLSPSDAAFKSVQESLAMLAGILQARGAQLNSHGDVTFAYAIQLMVALGLAEVVAMAALAVMVARGSKA